MLSILERAMVEDTEYTMFSTMKFFEDHDETCVYGLRVRHQQSQAEHETAELPDVSCSLDTCKTIFDNMVTHHAFPIHTQDIVLDFISI